MRRSGTVNRPAMGLVRDRDRVLVTVAATVDLDDDEVWVLAERMEATMRARADSALGLAAPQVGRSSRLVTVTAAAASPRGIASDRSGWASIANPSIVERAGEVVTKAEGCLSMPHRYWQVPRHTEVVVAGFDMRTELDVHLRVTDPLLARLWQHEVDHLDGRLISRQGYAPVA